MKRWFVLMVRVILIAPVKLVVFITVVAPIALLFSLSGEHDLGERVIDALFEA